VEQVRDGFLAAAWSGPYETSAPLRAATSIGTGLWVHADHIAVLCGNAGSDVVFLHRGPAGLTVANALPAALALAGDEPRAFYAFYNQDFMSYVLGGTRYRRPIPMRHGWITPYYRSIRIGRDRRAVVAAPVAPPVFADFAAYRRFLVTELAALFANAASSRRRIGYAPVCMLSSGYDSVAAAVLAREAACADGVTYREASQTDPGTSDSGEAIGQHLGLRMSALETLAYRRRTDLPELEFIAAGYGGSQVHMAGSEQALAGRLLVTGFGGDLFWDRDFGLAGRAVRPHHAGGYSAVNFHLRLPALAVALPAIGAADDPAPIGRLSRGDEMAPWSVGGDYDRPLPRRIAEEAGIPRGSFAHRKLMVTPSYDSLGRSRPPLGAYLGDTSLARFEAWLHEQGGFSARQAWWRNKLVAPAARFLWSGRVARTVRRWGYDWPPFPAALWHLRAAVRENAFVFHWAVHLETQGYRHAVDRAAEAWAPFSREDQRVGRICP
jgi:hypothetical protein